MIIELYREHSAKGWMHGKLVIDGLFRMYTLEDEQREKKVYGETAIPSGTYKLELVDSARFGKDTISLVDVPNFHYIRVHCGNTDEDTHGCILVGRRRFNDRISDSRLALADLKLLVIPPLERGEDVWLRIHNAPGARYVDTNNDCPEFECDNPQDFAQG
jgi:hypothetical protein